MSAEHIADVTAAKSVQDIRKRLEERERGSPTEALATAGGEYPLGAGTIKPFRLDALPCLAILGSPFVGARDDVEPSDVIDALYVVAHGRAAMQPLMALQYRRRAILELQAKVGQDTAMLRVLADKLDEVTASAMAGFQTAALDYWSTLRGVSLQEAADMVTRVLADGFSGFDMLPRGVADEGDAKKKTCGPTPSATPGSSGTVPKSSGWRRMLSGMRSLWRRSDI
jgi:hypothetical protein